MTISESDLESFQQFARERIASITPETSLDELAYEWQISRERGELNDVIREGLDDIQAGHHRPAREATEELARKHRLSTE